MTDRPVRLRAMVWEDLDAVLALERLAHSHPWTRGNFIDALAAGYVLTVLTAAPDREETVPVERDGRVLAYSAGMVGVEEIHLLNLTVAPEVQGLGLARRLLDVLCQRAVALGCPRVWLEVRPSNARAVSLYARYGFGLVACRRAYYPLDQGQREDALIMRLDLTRVEPVGNGLD